MANMSSPWFSVKYLSAQTTASPQPSPAGESFSSGKLWMFSTIGLAVILVAVVVCGTFQLNKMSKAMKFQRYKTKDLHKRLKLALTTMRKLETNPDLVHSRDCNLDYIRMRMEEEVFHYALVNQSKIKIKQLLSAALRSKTASQSTIGIANKSGCKIDETFDVTYETDIQGKRTKRVLFRIQIKLMKLPAQSTSATISQIIDCIETFLSPIEERENWQPTIQGHIVHMNWDQKAKPTPLLLLEQYSGGINVSFRTNPIRRAIPKRKGSRQS